MPGAGDLLSSAPPEPPEVWVRELVARLWGFDARLSMLRAERDANYRLRLADGSSLVLKLGNPLEPEPLQFGQNAALRRIAERAPDLPVPRVVPALSGEDAVRVVLPDGRPSLARILTWAEGEPWAALPRQPALAREAGVLLARMTLALDGFDAAQIARDEPILWDIRHLPRLRPMLADLPDVGLAGPLLAFVNRFEAEISPALEKLPLAVVHNDANHHNIIVTPDGARIAGLIDFGDMVETQAVNDVAVALSYFLGIEADPAVLIPAFLQGYEAYRPLAARERALLADLILARMVCTLTITGWRAARYPENAAYILRNAGPARRALDWLGGLATARLSPLLMPQNS